MVVHKFDSVLCFVVFGGGENDVCSTVRSYFPLFLRAQVSAAVFVLDFANWEGKR